MSKTKAGITAGAVLLSAALAVILFNPWLTTQSFDRANKPVASSQAPTPTASQPDQVWTYNCELPVQRPEEILLTCADGGWLVTDIKWATWSPKGASGTGIYSENQCEPSCASGRRIETMVEVRLRNLFVQRERNFFQTLEIEAENGTPLLGGTDILSWDVFEFAKQMN